MPNDEFKPDDTPRTGPPTIPLKDAQDAWNALDTENLPIAHPPFVEHAVETLGGFIEMAEHAYADNDPWKLLAVLGTMHELLCPSHTFLTAMTFGLFGPVAMEGVYRGYGPAETEERAKEMVADVNAYAEMRAKDMTQHMDVLSKWMNGPLTEDLHEYLDAVTTRSISNLAQRARTHAADAGEEVMTDDMLRDFLRSQGVENVDNIKIVTDPAEAMALLQRGQRDAAGADEDGRELPGQYL